MNHDDVAKPGEFAGDEPGPGMLDFAIIESVLRSPLPPPQKLDEKILQKALASTDQRGQRESVGEYHRLLYEEGPGAELPRLRAHEQLALGFDEEAARHDRVLARRAQRTNRYLEEPAPRQPLSNFQIVQVVMFGLMSAVMIVVGWQALAVILISSGLPVFQSEFRAQTFSALSVVGPFMLKSLASVIGTDLGRQRYVGFIYLAASVIVPVWFGLFTATFGDGFSTTSGGLPGLGWDENQAGQGGAGVGHALMAVGLLAEMFVAAGCWLYIENLLRKHSPSRPIDDPHYLAIERERNKRARERTKVMDVLGRIRSRMQKIEVGGRRFVDLAVGVYDGALAKRGNIAFAVKSAGDEVGRINGAIRRNGNLFYEGDFSI